MSTIYPTLQDIQKAADAANGISKPNYRAIANRLVGCRGMDDESFFKEVIGELEAADMNGRITAYAAIETEIKG